MQYMGGKTRIAKQIAAEIDKVRKPGQLVWDAFCGGLSVSVALSKNGPVLASDVCAPLINLYKAVQEGWDPPTEVSKETWQAAKSLPDTDPMKAFCGFGMSYGGAWFHTYNGNRTHKVTKIKPSSHAKVGDTINKRPAKAASESLIKSCRKSNIQFMCLDFLLELPPLCDCVIYCDSPYQGTYGYEAVGNFNQDQYRHKIQNLANNHHIFVSEYAFSIGTEVWSKSNLNSGYFAKNKTEKLFYIPKQT